MARRRARRSEDVAAEAVESLLMQVPAWVGPLLAILTFALLRFVVPPVLRATGAEVGAILAGACEPLSWLIGMGLLVFWIVAELRKYERRRLLDSQQGIATVRALSWQQFEQLVSEYYRRKGYKVHETGGGGADGGVDLVLERDGQEILVQCKRWRTRQVGVRVARELYGVVSARGAAGGIVITSGCFTQDARDFAQGNRLELVDGPNLVSLIESVQNTPKTDETRAPSAGKAQPHEASTPDHRSSTAAVPACPQCGAPMVRRTARHGQHTGSDFFGCSRYPQCRGTRPVE